MKREEFIEKWGASMGHGFTDEELSADLDELLSLPPAEGAKEILEKHLNLQFKDTPEDWTVALIQFNQEKFIAAMQEFATLHAQRIAEKMVRDRLKKVESLLNSAAGLVGNPGTNISGSCDVACDMWQKNYEAYLKIRESND